MNCSWCALPLPAASRSRFCSRHHEELHRWHGGVVPAHARHGAAGRAHRAALQAELAASREAAADDRDAS